MPGFSRVTLSLAAPVAAAIVAAAALAMAEAQKPTPPTPPKPPVKPASTLKPASAPGTGLMLIICKDFRFEDTLGARPYKDSRITYETMTVREVSGAIRTIYAPTHIVITHEFKPASTPIGPDGRGLLSGQCGTPNAVIAGATGPVSFQFDNFPSVFVQVGTTSATDMPMRAAVNLPPCPSGLRSLKTLRQNANDFLIADAASVTCLR